MAMRTYEVTLTGFPTSMLMHVDNIEATDRLKEWRSNPANKKISVSGDDRSPAWTWLGYLSMYRDQVVVPSANLMACLKKAGANFEMPSKGRTKLSLKSATQSGILFDDEGYPITVEVGKKRVTIEQSDLEHLASEAEDFAKHQADALKLGIILDMHRVSIGQTKHIRVRPSFAPGWKCTARFSVDAPELSEKTLRDLWEYGGDKVGLMDWRPSSPKGPGPHGRFTAVLKAV